MELSGKRFDDNVCGKTARKCEAEIAFAFYMEQACLVGK